MSVVCKSLGDELTVVVVGASGGIGKALINRLLSSEQVVKVYGLSRTLQQYDSDKYSHYYIDYAVEDSIEAIAAALPALDMVFIATGLLHDSLGLQPEKTINHLSSDDFLKVLLVNTVGPALVAKHLLPLMKKGKKTAFAALSARVGSISDNRLGGWYAYRASKAALNMMIKTLAIEYQRRYKQLLIVGLHPGTVDTELSKPFQRNVSPPKLFTADYSIEQMLSVLDNLVTEDSGYCFAWDGMKIPE